MLIEHQAIKPDLLTIFVFIEIGIVEVRTELGVKMAVGKGQADGTIGTVLDILGCIVDVGALGKSHQKHGAAPLRIGGTGTWSCWSAHRLCTLIGFHGCHDTTSGSRGTGRASSAGPHDRVPRHRNAPHASLDHPTPSKRLGGYGRAPLACGSHSGLHPRSNPSVSPPCGGHRSGSLLQWGAVANAHASHSDPAGHRDAWNLHPHTGELVKGGDK